MGKGDAKTVATIDEALDQTRFGRFNYLIIIFSGVVLINVVLESIGISFVLPVLQCDMNLTSRQQGMLGALGFLGIIASSHFWGFLADTTGRRSIMQPALILQFLVTVISSFSPNFETLAFMRFLNGLLLSAGSATIFAYLGEFHSQQHRNRAILAAAFISAFSAIFFPIMAWVFINQHWEFYVPYLNIVYKPWRSYILAVGVPGFICGLALFYLPESPKYLLSVGRGDEALEVLRIIHRKNTEGAKSLKGSAFEITALLPDLDTPIRKASGTAQKGNAVVALLQSMWQQTAPLFMRAHLRKTFLASLIQFFIFFTAHGVYMWFPYILNTVILYTNQSEGPAFLCDILQQAHLTNETEVFVEGEACVTHLEISTYKHTIVLEFIYVSLLLIVCYSIGKFGRQPILFIILVVCGACGVLSLVVKVPLLAVYLFVVFLCCGLGTTVVNAIVVDIYPTNLRAMAVCISLMLGRIGSVLGSNVLGTFVNDYCRTSLYTSACCLVLAGVLGFLLPRRPNTLHSDKETNSI